MPVPGWTGHYIAVARAQGPVWALRSHYLGRLGRHNMASDSSGLGSEGRDASIDMRTGPSEMAGAYIDIASVARPSLIVRTPSREHEGKCGQLMCVCCAV